MALMRCPDCRRPFSDTAKACPTCGFSPARARRKQRRPLLLRITLISVAAVVVIGSIFLCINETKNEKRAKEAQQIQENFGLFDELQKLRTRENIEKKFSFSSNYRNGPNESYRYYDVTFNGKKGTLEIDYTDGGSVREAEFCYDFKSNEEKDGYLTPNAKGKARTWFLETLNYYTKKYGTPDTHRYQGSEWYTFHAAIGTEITLYYDEDELNSYRPFRASYISYDFYASPINYFHSDNSDD